MCALCPQQCASDFAAHSARAISKGAVEAARCGGLPWTFPRDDPYRSPKKLRQRGQGYVAGDSRSLLHHRNTLTIAPRSSRVLVAEGIWYATPTRSVCAAFSDQHTRSVSRSCTALKQEGATDDTG